MFNWKTKAFGHTFRAYPSIRDPSQGPRASMAYFDEIAKNRGLLARFVSILPAVGRHRRRSRLLDVRSLSDHLKRDMGFLDGLPTDKRC
jgi:hypothetical protein